MKMKKINLDKEGHTGLRTENEAVSRTENEAASRTENEKRVELLSDKEAAEKIMALVPKERLKKIPFFMRRYAIRKGIKWANEKHPDLFAVAKRPGDLPDKERKEIEKIIKNMYGRMTGK